jgi:hypothetical protein
LATSENYLKLKPRSLPDSARPGQEIFCRVEGRPAAGGSAADGADADALFVDL